MEPNSTNESAAASTVAAFIALDDALWEPLASAALLRAQPQFDETVLDAWCRDGAAALPTAALVGPAGHVDAIDPDDALASIARERGEHEPQLRVHVADPAEWPTGDYDLVQCVLGLASCSTPDDTARHLVSLVKPGGRLVVSLWAQGALAPLDELAREALAAEGDDADDPDETDVPHETSAASVLPGTAGTLATLLHDLDLIDVRAEHVDRHLELVDDLAWQLVLGARLLPADTLEVLDDEALERVRQRVLDGVAERGLTRVDASTLIAVGHRTV